MPERFNVRILDLPTAGEIAREVARIERYPERVAAITPKGLFILIHAAGLSSAAAMILKQELLALDADCVISPEVYLGDRAASTDALIMATTRQYRALIPRLRLFPIGDLPGLASEIEQTLAAYEGVPEPLEIRGMSFHWGERTYVMGILNVTPDSFSGDGLLTSGQPTGGQNAFVAAALAQAHSFAAGGADVLDVGGESTRPGARPVEAAEERRRVEPVIAALRAALALPISIDTSKAEVAEAALDAGADIVNDVWGLRQPGGGWNEDLAKVVADRGVPIVLMHNRRAPATSGAIGGHYQQVHYDDLLGDIVRELRESIAFAESHGIERKRIIVDPGIGFGKTPDQNIEVLRQLRQLCSIGRPILLGTSRKSFIGRALHLGPDERAEGTGATVALGIQAGVDMVRVHDVEPIVRIARMTDAIVRPGAWERATASTR
ncbi:MAG TPA: dihydropteroate synthase [Herpetosiphonaceae bacterium]|nr:dihydropteroate synthase [Herpetosiphonaceae bacterium]